MGCPGSGVPAPHRQHTYRSEAMKRSLVFAAVAAMIPLTLRGEMPLGEFSNLRLSEVSGDLGGYRVVITQKGSGLSGVYTEAAGVAGPEVPLESLKCGNPAGACSFRCQSAGVLKKCTLALTGGHAVLSCGNDRSFLLFRDGRVAALPGKDAIAVAWGNAREAASVAAKVRFTLGPLTKVRFVAYRTDGGYFAEIEYGGRRGFVPLDSFSMAVPEMILGEGVRFREGPSADAKILASLCRGTIVGCLPGAGDDRWAAVSYRGVLGYVSRNYITGY
jgi:hypothetical protein